MHLFYLKEDEKECFESRLSDRALNVFVLMEAAPEAFLTHDGMSPHLRKRTVE